MPRAAPPGARAAPAVGGNGTAAAAAEGPEFAWAAAAAAGKGARRRPGAWAPMQPAPGVFDRRVLRWGAWRAHACAEHGEGVLLCACCARARQHTNEVTRQTGSPCCAGPRPHTQKSRDGLDWVIAQAAARGMRTLLVLTDAGGAAAGAAPASGGGGAPAGASAGRAGYAGAGAGAGAGGAAERYCRWVDSGAGELSIGDFYANDTVKARVLGGTPARRRAGAELARCAPANPAPASKPVLRENQPLPGVLRRPPAIAAALPHPPPCRPTPQSVFLDHVPKTCPLTTRPDAMHRPPRQPLSSHPPCRPQSVFLDHVGVLLSRVNSVTGYEYRFDPAILGWCARPASYTYGLGVGCGGAGKLRLRFGGGAARPAARRPRRARRSRFAAHVKLAPLHLRRSN